ncbi:hypothetical protein N658DRAFT_494232, partial [Parathielavia hyrcaniae]
MAVDAAVSTFSSDTVVHGAFSTFGINTRLRFIETYKKRDFKQIWLDLCQDDPEAKAAIRSYLRDYVENSQTTRPVLGEQEFEYVQTITCTTTVITHWKNLVAHADNMILRPMRRDDPDNWQKWKLRWDRGE